MKSHINDNPIFIYGMNSKN